MLTTKRKGRWLEDNLPEIVIILLALWAIVLVLLIVNGPSVLHASVHPGWYKHFPHPFWTPRRDA